MSFFSIRRKTLPDPRDEDKVIRTIERSGRWSIGCDTPQKKAAIIFAPSLSDENKKPDCLRQSDVAIMTDPDSVSTSTSDESPPKKRPDTRLGRRMSVSEVFGGLRRRSRSISRNNQSSQGLLRDIGHGVVQAVKNPSALFSSQSPAKGVDPRTNRLPSALPGVNFSIDDANSKTTEGETRSIAIHIPRRNAPLLPPLDMPSSTLMNIEKETLTARPPRTPVLDNAMSAIAAERATELHHLSASHIQGSHSGQFMSAVESNQNKDPFDNNAAVYRELQKAITHAQPKSALQAIPAADHVDASEHETRTPSHGRQGTGSVISSEQSVLAVADPLAPAAAASSNYTGICGSTCSTESDDDAALFSLDLKRAADLVRPLDGGRNPPLLPPNPHTANRGGSDVDMSCDNMPLSNSAVCDSLSREPDLHQYQLSNQRPGPEHVSHGGHRSADSVDVVIPTVRPPTVDDLTMQEHGELTARASESESFAGRKLSLRSRATGSLNRSPARARRVLRFKNSVETQLMPDSKEGKSRWNMDAHQTSDSTRSSTATPIEAIQALCPFFSPSSKQNTDVLSEDSCPEHPTWSPFCDKNFPPAAFNAIMLSKEAFKTQICRTGGFFEFWRNAHLSDALAPTMTCDGLSAKDADVLIEYISRSQSFPAVQSSIGRDPIAGIHSQRDPNTDAPNASNAPQAPNPVPLSEVDGDNMTGDFSTGAGPFGSSIIPLRENTVLTEYRAKAASASPDLDSAQYRVVQSTTDRNPNGSMAGEFYRRQNADDNVTISSSTTLADDTIDEDDFLY